MSAYRSEHVTLSLTFLLTSRYYFLRLQLDFPLELLSDGESLLSYLFVRRNPLKDENTSVQASFMPITNVSFPVFQLGTG